MPGEVIDTAFVEIRPLTTGFAAQSEAALVASTGRLQAGAASAGLAAGAGFGKSFAKGFLGVTIAVLGVEKLSQGLRSSVQVSGELQKSSEAVGLEFGAAAKTVTDFANSAKGIGISARQSEALSVRIGILAHNLGIGQEQAAKMTIDLQRLAGSIAEIRGIDPATVLQNLPQALAGNLRSLKQLGFAFSIAQIKAEAVAQGVLKVNQALTPAAKAVGVYGLLVKQLGFFEGQAALHTGDLVNQQHRLAATTDNTKASLGGLIRGPLAGITSGLADSENALVRWGEGLKRDSALMATFRATVQGIGIVLHGLGVAVGSVVSTLGVPAIISAVVAYKAFGVIVGLAGAIETRYQAILVRGATIRVAAASASTALTVAEREQLVAAEAQAGGLANMRAGLFGTISPLGLAAAGVAVLAGGLVFLLTREDAVTAGLRRLRGGLVDVGIAQDAAAHASLAAAEADTAVTATAQALEQARVNAAEALKTSGRNSLAYRTALTQVVQAEQAAKEALLAQGEAHKQVQKTTIASTEAQKKAARDIAGAYRAASASILKAEGSVFSSSKNTVANLAPVNDALRKYATGVHDAEQAAGNAKGTTADYVKTVHALFVELGRLPNLQEIQLRVKPTDPIGPVLKTIEEARRNLRLFGNDLRGIDGRKATVTIDVLLIDPSGLLDPSDPIGAALRKQSQAAQQLGGGGFVPPGSQPKQTVFDSKLKTQLTPQVQAVEQLLRDNVDLAKTDAGRKVALRKLAALYGRIAKNDEFSLAVRRAARVAQAQTNAEIERIDQGIVDDQKRHAEEMKRKREEAHQAFLDSLGLQDLTLEVALERAQLDGRIGLQEKILRQRIAFFRKEESLFGLATAAGKSAAQSEIAAEQQLRDLQRSTLREKIATQEQALQDAVTLAQLDERSVKDDEQALRRLIRFEARQSRNKKLSIAERRQHLIAERQAEKDLRDLLKQRQQETASFQKQSFAFLGIQQGFAANLASNLLGNVAGLVGGSTPSPTSAPGATPTPLAPPRPLPGKALAVEVTREQGGRAPSSGQLETLIHLARRQLQQLELMRASAAHPNAKTSRTLAHAAVETTPHE